MFAYKIKIRKTIAICRKRCIIYHSRIILGELAYRLRGRCDLRPVKPDLDNANVGILDIRVLREASTEEMLLFFIVKQQGSGIPALNL